MRKNNNNILESFGIYTTDSNDQRTESYKKRQIPANKRKKIKIRYLEEISKSETSTYLLSTKEIIDTLCHTEKNL